MEFLSHYYEKNGVPLRARLFGNIHRVNRWFSGPIAPVANWIGGLSITKQLNERLLGIGKERQLPQFARQPFTTWFKNRSRSTESSQNRPKVVLFNDTFNTYNSPHISIAATEVLEAAGFEVG